jgi:hypothetical protein
VNDAPPRTSSASPTATPPSPASDNVREIEELVAQMMAGMKPPEINADLFVSGACSMFATFPIEACRAVANLGTGYPSTEQYSPTLAALRLALEIAARPHLREREREARQRKLAQERAEAAAPSGPRPGYEELQRRCAALGLVIGAKRGRAAEPPARLRASSTRYGEATRRAGAATVECSRWLLASLASASRRVIDAAAGSARVREQYGIPQDAWDALPKADPKAAP